MVSTTGQRQKFNAIRAINARGEFWGQDYTGKLNGLFWSTLTRGLSSPRSFGGRYAPLHTCAQLARPVSLPRFQPQPTTNQKPNHVTETCLA